MDFETCPRKHGTLCDVMENHVKIWIVDTNQLNSSSPLRKGLLTHKEVFFWSRLARQPFAITSGEGFLLLTNGATVICIQGYTA